MLATPIIVNNFIFRSQTLLLYLQSKPLKTKPIMAKKEKFTVKQGLAVQAKNMAHWKKLLKRKHYQTLVETVNYANTNNHYRDGYDVMRGSDITTAVGNLAWTRVELGLSPGSKCTPLVLED